MSFHPVELSTQTTSVPHVMKETVFNGSCSLINVLLSANLLIIKSVTLHVRTIVLQLNSPILQVELVKLVELLIVRPVMKMVSVFNVILELLVLLLVELIMIQDTLLTMYKVNV